MGCTFETGVVDPVDDEDAVLADPHPMTKLDTINPASKNIRDEYSFIEYPPV
jgi:hypothetical protein